MGPPARLGARQPARSLERLGARLRAARARPRGAVRRTAPTHYCHPRRTTRLGGASLPALPRHRARRHRTAWPAHRVLRTHHGQQATHRPPLYAPPAGLRAGQPWHSRQDIDTLPAPQAALQGRAIAWLADPIDALILQIQGSGRLNITEANGSQRQVRVAFAAHNGQPYKSVGRWLLDQRAIREASWDAIKAWAAQNPQRVNDMLWSNPRTVFFREEKLSEFDARFGPRGAQGVPLTPGRSIAVDPQSIPYGTPVWLATQGPTLNLQQLVMAQDTGGAIVGAVRADLFTGWGGWTDPAYTVAAALKQPLQLWALWPR